MLELPEPFLEVFCSSTARIIYCTKLQSVMAGASRDYLLQKERGAKEEEQVK